MEQKKKSNNYIIPATFFTSLSPLINKEKELSEKNLKIPKEIKVTKQVVNTEIIDKKPLLKNIKRRTSALSLKSIHQKTVLKNISDDNENFDNHPKTPFTNEELNNFWTKYSLKTQQIGEHSIAAVLDSSKPILQKDYKIIFSIPNDLMQIQLERIKPKLIKFLRDELKNYGITITFIVNKVDEKKFAYTPHEKYTKLKEKNPLIQKLKNIFSLEL